MLIHPIKKRTVSKEKFSKRELPMSDFIPYDYHWDKETIITKNKELMQIIKLEGFSFETADDDAVDMKKLVRNSLYKSMADGTFSLYFHTIRRRQGAYPEGDFPKGFARDLNNHWKKRHHSRSTFVNDLYITVVRRYDTRGVANVENWFNRFEQKANKDAEGTQLREIHKELKEAIYRVLATFKDYGARLLTTKMTEYGPVSEPLEFLGRLINGVSQQQVLVPSMQIAKYLAVNRLYFGQKAIEIRTPTGTRYAGIVSIREYSPHTAAGIMDAFLQLPFEFIISQSYQFLNRSSNLQSMQLRQRRMMQAQDLAVSQVHEISTALDLAVGGHIAFGEHHLTVTCFEDSLNGLEAAMSMAVAELVNVGIHPVREQMVLEQCYWSMQPANWDYIARKSKINTLNISAFAAMHNYPVGKAADNHWGDAVSVFDTTSGTPYFFNFHSRDVGHTMIVGPTGAGKTVLMNFLTAQAQKFKCRTFLFDKDRGSEVFVRAIGGQYTLINPGKRCYFNPLQLDDTSENRNFITEWLQSLVSINGEPLSAEENDIVLKAVDGNYNLAKEDRMLRNIAPFMGLDTPGSLAGRLKPWHSGGRYANLFDDIRDVVDFQSDTVFGFEMGEVLENKGCLIPVLLYLFHRIQLSLDGTPTIIVLDEAWALIDNKVFAAKIKDWLKTLRKLNGMVVFATQSVEDALNSEISDTLVQQTATQIFLPNPKATDAYRKAFMLSEREFTLLKTTDPGSRYFLLKQGADVVVARIDLSQMDDEIAVLSGRAETITVLDEVRTQLGDDPEKWLPVFCRKVANL
jgi:type IV secretion system protein VirB4